MDKRRRNNLRRVVSQCRKIAEENLRRQLLRYGIQPDRGIAPLASLTHLNREEREIRRRLEGALEKERVGGLPLKKGIIRYIRSVGFTVINRLAALRAMEVRGLIKETVIRRSKYGGRSLRERDVAEENPHLQPDEVLKKALLDAFQKVGEEIHQLFDTLDDPYSFLFLSPRPLREIISLLTEEVSEEDWKEDDIIGWIYQYYNDELRKEIRQANRELEADDIPPINQFYTPHWVVRALVDNTLGRLWLEMNRRCPKLGKVRRTENQIKNPDGKTVEEFCSYFVPLSEASPNRPKKSVREIKVLDPACGSGHFLTYAFDVLYRMYQEAEPQTPLEEIPGLILEHNLYGMDIDLRAVQLAAVSFYLKAKSYNPRFKVRQMNLVCADSKILDGKKRLGFLQRFSHDEALRRIFSRVLEDLNNTNQLGSLFKVRQPFQRLFEQRRMKLDEFKRKQVQLSFLPEKEVQLTLGNTEVPVPTQMTLQEMVDELKRFERQAMEKRDMGTLLFATEAEKSVGLLSLLSEHYDVVLMNPPYGDMPETTKGYLKEHYPRTKNDLYAAFIEQALGLCQRNGFVGMLTSRTFMFLKTFQKVREEILKSESLPELLLDTGFGILDGATVETAATVFRKTPWQKQKFHTPELQERGGSRIVRKPEDHTVIFCRLSFFDTFEKENAFVQSLSKYLETGKHSLWYRTTLGDLAQVPSTTYAYWASPSLRKLFTQYPPLDRDVAGKPNAEKIADVKQGIATADDARFTRRFWEVASDTIGKGKKWVPFAKGGEYAKFYADIDLVLNWENSGEELRDFEASVIRNESFYFQEGLTWSNISSIGFSVREWRGDVFSVQGMGLFLNNSSLSYFLLGHLNSTMMDIFFLMSQDERHYQVGRVAELPIPRLNDSLILESLTHEACDLLRDWDTGNEVSTLFSKPWLLQVLHGFDPTGRPVTGHPFAEDFQWAEWESLKQIQAISAKGQNPSLCELTELCVKRERLMKERLEKIQRQIDEEVYRLYNISDEDRALIERELALRKGKISLENESKEKNEKEETNRYISPNEHVQRLFSFYVRQVMEEAPYGIVPLDEMFEDCLSEKVREKIGRDFGEENTGRIEMEAGEILGESLREWLIKDYFDFHLSLYKRRPIFWQLTSFRFGKSRVPGTFSCFIHYHKLTRDTIPKVRAHYLWKVKEVTQRQKERLFKELENARGEGDRKRTNRLSKSYETVANQLEQLKQFEKALERLHNFRSDGLDFVFVNKKWVNEKIHEVRDRGWRPILDYGVRVNIEPLKELGLLPRSAERIR